MRRDLDRRLGAVEARRGGRTAAILRWLATLSDEELTAELSAWEHGWSGGFDPRVMTDVELEQSIAELKRLIARCKARATETAATSSLLSGAADRLG
jgi:hypothetical protein